MRGASFAKILTLFIFIAAPVSAEDCEMTTPPRIEIKPVTRDIEYDFSKSAKELTKVPTDTESPYGLGVDTITKGLRHDKPHMSYNVSFHHTYNASDDTFCVWYDTITVDIELKPKIYVAKEYNKGACAEFTLVHERKHVRVDREVMNKYAKIMGRDIQKYVDVVGVRGPFPSDQADAYTQKMADAIETIISNVTTQLNKEMDRRQQAIDSLEEYEHGRHICEQTFSAEELHEIHNSLAE